MKKKCWKKEEINNESGDFVYWDTRKGRYETRKEEKNQWINGQRWKNTHIAWRSTMKKNTRNDLIFFVLFEILTHRFTLDLDCFHFVTLIDACCGLPVDLKREERKKQMNEKWNMTNEWMNLLTWLRSTHNDYFHPLLCLDDIPLDQLVCRVDPTDTCNEHVSCLYHPSNNAHESWKSRWRRLRNRCFILANGSSIGHQVLTDWLAAERLSWIGIVFHFFLWFDFRWHNWMAWIIIDYWNSNRLKFESNEGKRNQNKDSEIDFQ